MVACSCSMAGTKACEKCANRNNDISAINSMAPYFFNYAFNDKGEMIDVINPKEQTREKY